MLKHVEDVLGVVVALVVIVGLAVAAAWVMVHDVPREHAVPAGSGNGFARTPRGAPSALHGWVLYRERGMSHTRAEQWDNGRCVIAYNITDDGFARIVECGR